jgi:Family of unknown function (DUF5675)
MNKKVKLVRGDSSNQGTFGLIKFGEESCFTLELPWRNNVPQKSCIPKGIYQCNLVKSPRFGIIYSILDVPGRSNVLIHSANLGGNIDEGFDTQLHGCIALFSKQGFIRNSRGNMQKAGLVSMYALRKFMTWANGSQFELEIL